MLLAMLGCCIWRCCWDVVVGDVVVGDVVGDVATYQPLLLAMLRNHNFAKSSSEVEYDGACVITGCIVHSGDDVLVPSFASNV